MIRFVNDLVCVVQLFEVGVDHLRDPAGYNTSATGLFCSYVQPSVRGSVADADLNANIRTTKHSGWQFPA